MSKGSQAQTGPARDDGLGFKEPTKEKGDNESTLSRRRLVREMRTPMIAPDRAVLDDPLAPELTYCHSDCWVQTKTAFRF